MKHRVASEEPSSWLDGGNAGGDGGSGGGSGGGGCGGDASMGGRK